MNRKLLTLAASLILSSTVHAGCVGDCWFGKDKAAHFGYSAIIASSVTAATQNEFYGLAAAVAVGAAKEGYDDLHRPKHDPSWKDFGVDVAGGIVGAKVGGLFIKRQNRGILVGFHKVF